MAKTMQIRKKAYSIREVSEITGFGKTHIYEECRKGKIQLRKSGKKTIVLEEELNRYLSALPVYQPINN
jgi:excisionase family DNA binding protein